MDNLTLATQNIDLHDEPEQLEQLLFRPQGKPATALDIIQVPRYLFRVVSPKSDGKTNEIWAKSVSACCDEESSREDIFSNLDKKKRATVANRLNLQLRWWPKRDCRDAHFVSWTSSLLFAIQYIYYRSKDPKDGSSFEDIDLYVIDTSKFPRGTWMRDLDLIEAFCGYHDREDRGSLKNFHDLRNSPDSEYYFGEYLSQGALKIENKCQRIPGHILLQNDRLHRIQPEFDTVIAEEREKPLWPKKVIYLRRVIRPPSGGLKLLTSADMEDRLQAIKEILEDIAPDWRFPIAIYLAALMGAKLSTQEFEQGQISENPFFEFFQSEFAGDPQLMGNDLQYNEFKLTDYDKMPELKLVKKIVFDIRLHAYRDKLIRHIRDIKDNVSKLIAHSPPGESLNEGGSATDDPKKLLLMAISDTLKSSTIFLETSQNVIERIPLVLAEEE